MMESVVSAFVILTGAIFLTINIRWFLFDKEFKGKTNNSAYILMIYGIFVIIIGLGISLV